MTPSAGSIRQSGAVLPLQARNGAGAWLSGHRSLDVTSIRHPVIEALGHYPTSDYGEQFWLPVVGPSSLWTYRRLATRLSEEPEGFRLDLSTLGREIGLGAGTGRNSPIVRTLTRLVDHHLAEIIDDRLGVYTSLPPLTRRQAARLPDHLVGRHLELATQHRDASRQSAEFVAEAGR